MPVKSLEYRLSSGKYDNQFQRLPTRFIKSSMSATAVVRALRYFRKDKAWDQLFKEELLSEYHNRLGRSDFTITEQKVFITEAKRWRNASVAGEMLRATINKKQKVDTDMIETTMEAFAAHSKLPEVRYLRRLLHHFGLQPTSRTATSFLCCYYSQPDKYKFYKNFDSMLQSGYRPTPLAILSLMKTAPDFKTCKRLYSDICSVYGINIPMPQAAPALIVSCVKNGEVKEATAVFESLSESERSVGTLNAIMRVYSTALDYESCINMLLSKGNPTPNTATYIILLDLCLSAMLVTRSTTPWGQRASSLWSAAYHSDLIGSYHIAELYFRCLCRTADVQAADSAFELCRRLKLANSTVTDLYKEVLWRADRKNNKDTSLP
eukprot:TRINITY_DN27506_c0_g1_i1.p1 TRINITY_DN27506_c0_g1~~TRINITY_DN27506_c0_g1_i1.p1  ORF type:complete len:379 (+),score=35.77 TRINITY_DN27506_c0_g1_i1:172-1308(+)